MVHERKELQHFTEQFASLNGRPRLAKRTFIEFAQTAVATYQAEPSRREEIARRVTSLWLEHSDSWRDPQLDELGGRFADLELPDAHVMRDPGESIHDRWMSLKDTLEELRPADG